MRYDLSQREFPLITSRKVWFPNVVTKLLLMLATSDSRPEAVLLQNEVSLVNKTLVHEPFYGQHVGDIRDLNSLPFERPTGNFQATVGTSSAGEPPVLDLSVTRYSGCMYQDIPEDIALMAVLHCLLARSSNLSPRYFTYVVNQAYISQDRLPDAQAMLNAYEQHHKPLPQWSTPGYKGYRLESDMCWKSMRFGPYGLDHAWTKTILDMTCYAFNGVQLHNGRSGSSMQLPIAYPERILFRVDDYYWNDALMIECCDDKELE